MDALVVFDSRFGQTEQIARAIAAELGSRYTTHVLSVSDLVPRDAAAVDLLVVGGPTHAHGLSTPMRDALRTLARGSLDGVAVASFDTRFHLPRWLTGAAGVRIAGQLRRAGGRLLLSPESFFVARTAGNPLLPGELERATAWTQRLLSAALPVAAAATPPSGDAAVSSTGSAQR